MQFKVMCQSQVFLKKWFAENDNTLSLFILNLALSAEEKDLSRRIQTCSYEN